MKRKAVVMVIKLAEPSFLAFCKRHPYALDMEPGETIQRRFAGLVCAAASAAHAKVGFVNEQTGDRHTFRDATRIAPVPPSVAPFIR
jgi:hypothetical protein